MAALGGREPGESTAVHAVRSFWSDLFALRFRSFGLPALGDEARLEEGDYDKLTDGLLVRYFRRSVHVGTIAINLPPTRYREFREAFTTPA